MQVDNRPNSGYNLGYYKYNTQLWLSWCAYMSSIALQHRLYVYYYIFAWFRLWLCLYTRHDSASIMHYIHCISYWNYIMLHGIIYLTMKVVDFKLELNVVWLIK